MKITHIILLLLSLGVSAAGGFAAGIFIYPFWFPPPVAMEQLDAKDARELVAQGTFIHADPSDPIHYGMGLVRLLKGDTGRHTVFLDRDFKVGPGPRYHVYLSPKADIRSSSDFNERESIDLGKLRSFEGSQAYKISSSVDLSAIKSVVIWCKEFGVLISPATLKKPAS